MTLNRTPIFDTVRRILGRGFTQAEVDRINAAFDQAEGEDRQLTALHHPADFFDAVRSAFGPIKQPQVDGFNILLVAMGGAGWPIAWTAYGLATAWHESRFTMQPVEEAYWKDDAWRAKHLRYHPHHGRGYVQLTWPANYERADRECKLEGRLLADLDLAMQPDIAAQIMVRGMAEGWFTGKKLADYLPASGSASHEAYERSRRIVNGTDKAAQIANLAILYEAALAAGGWE